MLKKIFCYSDKSKNFPENFIIKYILINPLLRKKYIQKIKKIIKKK